MNTNKTQTGAGNTTAAQKIEAATVNDALRWREAQDKAAFIADFLGLFSIDQLLHNPNLEDQTESRFKKLIAEDAFYMIESGGLSTELQIITPPDNSQICAVRLQDGSIEYAPRWKNVAHNRIGGDGEDLAHIVPAHVRGVVEDRFNEIFSMDRCDRQNACLANSRVSFIDA